MVDDGTKLQLAYEVSQNLENKANLQFKIVDNGILVKIKWK